MAEGLGKGLQNLVQRFESAPDLKTQSKAPQRKLSGLFHGLRWELAHISKP